MSEGTRRFEREHVHPVADVASAAPTAAVQRKAAASRRAQAADVTSYAVQRKGSGGDAAAVQSAATSGLKGSGGALPHADKIQSSFGQHDVSGVSAHVGGAATAACDQMGAQAYASGSSVAFRSAPDLHTAAHEAAHVVQQRGGVQLKGGVGQAGDAYERHADAVADKVVAGGSAESLLSQMSGSGGGGGVQRIVQRDGEGECVATPAPTTVTVTATRVNVRSSTSMTDRANIVGQLLQTEPVSVLGTEGEWLIISYNGQSAYIHAGSASPVGEGPQVECPVTETTPPADTDATTNPILQLAQDFNTIPLWNRGEAPPNTPAATHFRTPYLLNTVAVCDEAAGIKNLRIAAGRPNAGQSVSAVVGNNPFVGKATPAQVGIVAQAVIDNQHDGQTPATLQAYINNGRARNESRRNGKWGVDCSGLTGQAMHEMEGNGREGYSITNAASFRNGGSRGYPSQNPASARTGDVISYQTTNHVVVIYAKWDVQIPMAGDASRTKTAHKMGVCEAAGSGQVRDDNKFWYFPGATKIGSSNNLTGPTFRLGTIRSDATPVWQPVLAAAAYAGGASWVSSYTMNCAGDALGTNIRVKEANGTFTSTSERIANGAPGVELKEVEGSMVRVRVNGVDMQNGKEMWAPVRYVATSGTTFNIPSGNVQPEGFSNGHYSVVRNPNAPAPGAAAATPTDAPATP